MDNLITIRTSDEIDMLLEYLKDKDIVALDTETTGLVKSSEIIGWSICAEIGVAFYAVCAEFDTSAQSLRYLEPKDRSKEIMEALKTKRLVMHNAVFDCAKVNENYGVDLMPSVICDTMVLAHLVDENRRIGLKDLSVSIFGEDSTNEQKEMKESVARNGGSLTKANYEMYKADSELMAKYGAKDTILTWNLFHHLLPDLYEQKLDTFFFEESMPLLRGPTYQMNTVGMKIDLVRLATIKKDMEVEALELKEFVYREIAPHIEEEYPGTSAKKTFNAGSGSQLAWLLFHKLGNTFPKLSDTGRELAKYIGCSTYNVAGKKQFLQEVADIKGRAWKGTTKVRDPWAYLSTDEGALKPFCKKYKWVEALLKYKKLTKILGTYVGALETKSRYGIINPSFKQCGTTSGRYSCSEPNFQNLPRDDKRIKSCVVSRPGKVFVGADYSQLEPRVFASVSQDPALMKCFADGDDFYSVVGAPIFGITSCSMKKKDPNSFAVLHPGLRDKAKVIALATPYGRTARQQASVMGISEEESQSLINSYFKAYPKVELMMLESHQQALTAGIVHSVYGRPRRMPQAMEINKMYPGMSHTDLPYEARNPLNLAQNHRVQSTAASITNRAAIKFCEEAAERGLEAKIVLQVHDEIVVECAALIADRVSTLLKECMESAAVLPGVALIAEPKIANNLADLK